MRTDSQAVTVRVLAATVVLAIASIGVAQDGPARVALDGWIEAMNTIPAADLDAYVDAAFAESFFAAVPRDQVLAVHRQLQGAGTFTFARLEADAGNSIVALLNTSEGPMFRAQLLVAGDPPLIAGLLVQPYEEPAADFTWETLDDLAAKLSDAFGLPGVAIAVTGLDDAPEVGVAGVRSVAGGGPVQPGDAFHVGSVTKSINSTMLARLVEAGLLRWEASLAELIPELAADTPYADVTLAELVRHRGGVPQHLTFGDAEMARLNELPGSPTAQRAAYVAEVLQLEPLDRDFHYSNAGTAVAGYVGEVVSGREWGELIRSEVFEPLGLGSCGIGWPNESSPDAPVGHTGSADARTPQSSAYRMGAFLEPAGDVHCSAADLARYGQAHLAGLNGRDGMLSPASFRELHRVSGDAAPYAAGWGVDPDTGQHRHNGSAGTFFSYLVIDPGTDTVVVFLANAGLPEGQQAATRAVEEVLGRLEP